MPLTKGPDWETADLLRSGKEEEEKSQALGGNRPHEFFALQGVC